MGWVEYSLVFVVSAGVAFIASLYAHKLGLIASPGEHRTHSQPTPVVGGIGLFAGLLLGWQLSGLMLVGVFASLSLVFLVGALDDRFALPSWVRLMAQALAAYMMVELTGVRLISLGFIWSAENEVLLGDLESVILTVFATMGVINALNMSDGMDGLAGSLAILVLLALLWFHAYPPELIIVALLSVAGFLVWNLRVLRKRARMFMGDAGSTTLGLLLAYLLIANSQSPEGFPPVTALWLLALPLIDAVSVLFLRPLRRQSPFAADNDHYHHLLLRSGFGVNTALLVALCVQGGTIALGVLMLSLAVPERVQLGLFMVLFVLYFFILKRLSEESKPNC